jgi:hypothetical protein
MPIEAIEFYHERRDGPVLPDELVRQLAALAWCVLELDGREESPYLDEDNRFLTGKVARLDAMALLEDDRRVDCFLIELGDDAAFNLKAKRRLFSFEADDFGVPADWRLKESGAPDLWYNVAVTEFAQRLDRHG